MQSSLDGCSRDELIPGDVAHSSHVEWAFWARELSPCQQRGWLHRQHVGSSAAAFARPPMHSAGITGVLLDTIPAGDAASRGIPPFVFVPG